MWFLGGIENKGIARLVTVPDEFESVGRCSSSAGYQRSNPELSAAGYISMEYILVFAAFACWTMIPAFASCLSVAVVTRYCRSPVIGFISAWFCTSFAAFTMGLVLELIFAFFLGLPTRDRFWRTSVSQFEACLGMVVGLIPGIIVAVIISRRKPHAPKATE